MTARANKGKPTKAKPLVWHVCRFRERFELPDDQRFCRKGPLVFCREYVSAADDESANYLREVDTLTRHRNALELIGAWLLIRRAACARSRAYRGFLLTADNRPMSDAEIGRTILFCQPRRASRILKTLAEAGLVEPVICPIFDLAQNEAPAQKQAKTPRKQAQSRRRKSGRRDSVSRKNSKNLGRAHSPLRAKRKTELANGNLKEKEITGNGKEDQSRQENLSAPGKPPESTTEGATASKAQAPRRDIRTTGIVKLSDALPRAVDGLAHGYSLGADDFAGEIFALLQCSMDRESLDGRRELGNFRAALLAAVDAGLSPSQIEECIRKGKADAARIGKSRKRHYTHGGTPERYWRFLWGKHVDARRSGLAKGVG